MFQINDIVVYGAQGVCQIVNTENQKVGNEFRKYFVLKPKDDRVATFFVPCWNEKALAKMRKIMTKNQIDALIDSMPGQIPNWIANDNERKEVYKKILASGDQSAIVSMIQAIYLHKKEREAEGKRLHMSDERFMKDAEQLLYNEWQYVLNMNKAELMAYILERIEKK